MSNSAAVKKVRLFLGLTFGISWTIQGFMIRSGLPIDQLTAYVVPMMWTPTLASLITRLWYREGFRDVSFRTAGPVREWLWAWLAPLLIGGIAYGTAWTLGLDTLATPSTWQEWSLLGAFCAKLGLALTIGVPAAALTAMGEELGWRGYLLTRLVDTGWKRPVLWSGAIWALWHLPLIVTGQYASGPSPILSGLLFSIDIVAFGYLMARVRLSTGSVWPAVIAHASWNSVIQGVFDRFTAEGGVARTDSFWTGESGVLVVMSSLFVCTLVSMRPFAVKRSPGDEPTRWLSVRTD